MSTPPPNLTDDERVQWRTWVYGPDARTALTALSDSRAREAALREECERLRALITNAPLVEVSRSIGGEYSAYALPKRYTDAALTQRVSKLAAFAEQLGAPPVTVLAVPVDGAAQRAGKVMPSELPETRYDCTNCGPAIAVDADELCNSCGATAIRIVDGTAEYLTRFNQRASKEG